MTRVVIDTNVLVSGLLIEHGPPAAVLDLIHSGQLTWCVSEAIIAEYTTVLGRPKFAAIDPTRTEFVLEAVRQATLFTPSATLTESRDEPDNRFLECAEAARADYLVTGNKRHFPKQWKTTKIVNARELLSSHI